jgi:putative oxidoreductase
MMVVAKNAGALVPLRLVVGFGFVAHGYAKLARGPESFAAILHVMGIPAPGLMAMFGVHFRYGFSSIRLQAFSASGAVFGPVGYELNLLYVAALLVLALCGPGPLSVDRWLWNGKGEQSW